MSTIQFHMHNAVPQELHRYLGWANESISADEVLLYCPSNLKQDYGKPILAWIEQNCKDKTRFIPSSHMTVLAVVPLGYAAIMRLELSV